MRRLAIISALMATLTFAACDGCNTDETTTDEYTDTITDTDTVTETTADETTFTYDDLGNIIASQETAFTDMTDDELAELVQSGIIPRETTWLNLAGNNLTDITPLERLTDMDVLYLEHNEIADLSPLMNMRGLTRLTVSGNPVTDLSPLFALSELQVVRVVGIELMPEQIDELQGHLPECEIIHTPETTD
ncbi:MAG: hypothetical protein FWG45_01390 [Oscillospiraceae bacterium]|nr:hypothetical protein [Oscillospiraceae bacterium]